jgi:hypothetical protein
VLTISSNLYTKKSYLSFCKSVLLNYPSVLIATHFQNH